jgi:UDP-N-acetylglucosamine diphosphorylase/glucosamine-1-phosphate N-acetyltransferase
VSAAVRLYLFDDARARAWAPFTLTRPVGELRFGCLTQRERAERLLGVPCRGHLSRSALTGFDEPEAAPVVDASSVGSEDARVLLSSRAVPARLELAGRPDAARLTVEGATVGWMIPAGAPLPADTTLLDPERDTRGAAIEVGGTVLGGPWDLVAGTPARIAGDVGDLHPNDDHVPDGVIRIGRGALSLGAGAEVEPGVIVDTRNGPVRLEDGARVEGPARLVGPLWIGRSSVVFGGPVGTSSIGPVCKVRGEVADSVLLGFVNKAHDGHLGHAMLGRWVNLGAATVNSDLKNNYRTVRVWTPEGEEDTGLVKVGCFLGDHVKTGIGTMINTGSVIGAGSNVFGGLMPPTVVPPFSWGAGDDLTEHRFDKFVETAETAMARRGQRLTPGARGILERAWESTRALRGTG